MKLICYICLLLLSVCSVFAFVELNEIAYDPYDGNEWVELFNPKNRSVNLSSWILEDAKTSDELVCCSFDPHCSLILNSQEFVVVTDQDSQIRVERQLCVDDNSIGNGLGNTGDSITLKNGSFEDSFTYTKTLGGYNNNRTLEQRSDGTWGESLVEFGTIGEENSIWNFSAEFTFISITEFLPDPFGEDSAVKPLGEWVELYNSGEKYVNMKKLKLTDADESHEIYIADDTTTDGTAICPKCYKVVYRNKDSDFALNSKTPDEVQLFAGEFLIDSVSYTGAPEGMSLSFINHTWYHTDPTPGKENMYVGLCDWQIDISMENGIFTKEDFSFTPIVNRIVGFPQNVTVRGSIETIFGVEKKTYTPWTDHPVATTVSKTYSPNLPEGTYQVSFWIEGLQCTDFAEQNNRAVRTFAINPLYKKSDSLISIEKVYVGNDKKVEWADQFTAKIRVYKGDETRKSVQAWVEMDGEKISKTTKLLAQEPFKEYSVVLPFQLVPNCHNVISDGRALLVVEGFDIRVEESIDVQGVDKSVCKEYLSYVKELEKIKEEEIELFAQPQHVTNDTVNLSSSIQETEIELELVREPLNNSVTAFVAYESNSYKSQSLIPYFMVGLFGLFLLSLLKKI